MSVEQIARAICAAGGDDPDKIIRPPRGSTTQWEPFPLWQDFRVEADAVVELLQGMIDELEKGWTGEQWDSGWDSALDAIRTRLSVTREEDA